MEINTADITPENPSIEESFYTARKSIRKEVKTPGSAWKKFRNSSVFLTCSKNEASPTLIMEQSEENLLECDLKQTNFSEISEDLCNAMKDLVLSQKKRIEKSGKKESQIVKLHDMLTRSDPRKSVYDLRSRSVPRKTLFIAENASTRKSSIRYRTTPHVNKTRKMLQFSSNIPITPNGVDDVDNATKLDNNESDDLQNNFNNTVVHTTVKFKDELVDEIDDLNDVQMMRVDNEIKPVTNYKSIRFLEDENNGNITNKEKKDAINEKNAMIVKQHSNVLKDITTTAVGLPNMSRAKPKTKVKPFSFEVREQEFLKRKQERIKLAELRSNFVKEKPAHTISNDRRLTQAAPFSFEKRDQDFLKRKQERIALAKLINEKVKVEEHGKQSKPTLLFKARPASVLHKKPFEIQKSTKKLTSPVDPFQKKISNFRK